METDQVLKLLEIVIWPILAVLLIAVFFNHINNLFKILLDRIKAGAEFSTPWVSVGKIPSTVKAPEENEPITENHMALIHSSWRYPKKDREYERPMYCFHAIIRAPDEVLKRIEHVTYHLHPTYPNKVRVVNDRESHFKLKELAWGESNLKAEVKIENQDEPIMLTRYINLTESGDRIP